MDNNKYSKFTEYFSDYYAYRPALKRYFGKVTTAIVVNQLELRFGSYQNGFYKFLEPCEKHPLYRVGDSWEEELGLSGKEFRTAFDVVGYRYASKTQLKKVLQGEENPFQGKIYLSYKDKNSNLTFYMRSHVEAERIFTAIVNGFNPNHGIETYFSSEELLEYHEAAEVQHQTILQILCSKTKKTGIKKDRKIVVKETPNGKLQSSNVDAPGNSQREVTEETKGMSRNCPSGGHGTAHRDAPLLQNLTQKGYKNNHNQVSKFEINFEGSGEGSFFDWVKNKKNKIQELGLIETEFSSLQDQHLMQWFQYVSKSKAYQISVPKALLDEVRRTLLDKSQFNKCDNDFFRKLCAIDKVILSGKWRTPYSKLSNNCAKNVSRETNPSEHDFLREKLKDLKFCIRTLSSGIANDERLIKFQEESCEEGEDTSSIAALKKTRQGQEQKLKIMLSQQAELEAQLKNKNQLNGEKP